MADTAGGGTIMDRSNLEDNNNNLNVIKESITNGCKGFSLYYQPVVESGSDRLMGAEALLRWRDVQHGMVMPDQFIPLLEKDPLFPELGRWILQTALRDAKKIMEMFPDFMIGVNLSYAQLERPDFVDMVSELLRQEDFPADHLCLEITERCRMLDTDLLRGIIDSLRSIGVRFALDNFGMGSSAIGLLRDLPIDTIKVDRNFISDLETDERVVALVPHLVAVAEIFGADICAEGVETKGIYDILKKYRVNTMQGFFFSRPKDYEGFREYVASCM